jgi:hypothetical protein
METKSMKKLSKSGCSSTRHVLELRAELARRIASLVGSKEKLISDIPGLLLVHRAYRTHLRDV